MKKYDKKKFYGYIVQGNLREAVGYLKEFPSKKFLAEKYRKLYESQPRKLLKMSANEKINEILNIFQEYYYRVFWLKTNPQTAKKELCRGFAEKFGIDLPELTTDKETDEFYDGKIEPLLSEAVTNEGFRYLGGDTQGYLGPYIWKETAPSTFRVELPSGVTDFTVNMLKGFASRSWMAYISFGKIGTGGWAEKDGTLDCVWSSYRRQLNKPSFKVDFLKHEAQHAYDYRHYPDMKANDLEYRAKLVQLVYAKNTKRFMSFLSEANASDKNNSHAYAAYTLVGRLSEKIFGKAYQTDINKWERKNKEIAKASLELLNEYKKG